MDGLSMYQSLPEASDLGTLLTGAAALVTALGSFVTVTAAAWVSLRRSKNDKTQMAVAIAEALAAAEERKKRESEKSPEPPKEEPA